jgi:hypothetical protein
MFDGVMISEIILRLINDKKKHRMDLSLSQISYLGNSFPVGVEEGVLSSRASWNSIPVVVVVVSSIFRYSD